jgi:hypothetical protein
LDDFLAEFSQPLFRYLLRMTSQLCGELDNYLDGVMASDDRHRFEQHLDRCDACGQAVSFERSMRDAEAVSLDQVDVPLKVTRNARDAIRRWQLKCRIAWTSGLAAGLLVVFTFYAIRHPAGAPNLAKIQRDQIPDEQSLPAQRSIEVAEPTPDPQSREDAHRTTKIRVQPTASRRQVALSLPTVHENVTMVMVFPTTIDDRGGQPAATPLGDPTNR